MISRQEQVPQVQTAPRPTLPLNPIQNPPPIPPLPPELGRSDTRSGMRQAAPASNNRPPQLPPKPFPSINQSQKYLNGPPPSQPYSRAVDERYRYSKNEYVQDYPKNMPPMPGNVQHSFNNLNREYVPTTPKQQSARLNEQQSHQESYSPVSPLTPERKLDASFSSDESRRLIWTCCHCGSPCNVSLSPDRCSTCAHPRCNLCQAQFTQQGYTQQNLTQSHPTSSISTSESMENWHNKYHLQSLQQQSSGIHTDSRFPIIGISQKNKPSTKPMEDLLTSPFETPLPAPAADVAPPPIPPNPQKDAILSALSQTLTQQIRSTYDSNMGAIPPLRAQQSALQSTLTAINNEISQLNDLQVLLSSNEAILHKAMHNADQVMEDAKHRKIPGVDEVLVAPTIVAGQLYALVADQRSIEDCRGVLGRALDRGRIAPEVWAKVLFSFPFFLLSLSFPSYPLFLIPETYLSKQMNSQANLICVDYLANEKSRPRRISEKSAGEENRYGNGFGGGAEVGMMVLKVWYDRSFFFKSKV